MTLNRFEVSMAQYVTEILKEISDDPSLLNTKHKDNLPIRYLLQYAFDKRGKFLLPEGEPPYKKDAAPIGMSQSNFYQQIKKLYVFTRPDLKSVRREQLFIQLLEGLHPTEAEVMIAVKDQNITSLYPGITVDVMLEAGLVEPQYSFRSESISNEKGGKHIMVTLSDTAGAKESFGDKATANEAPKKRGRPPGKKNTPK